MRAGIGSCAADDEMNTSREPARIQARAALLLTQSPEDYRAKHTQQ